jgi:hypothetical protein
MVLATALACSSCGSGRPTVHTVRGRALHRNQPLANAVIVLHHLGDDPALRELMPNGRVDQDGNFTLTTYDPGDGAPAGEWAVTLTWPVPTRATADPERASSGADFFKGRYQDPRTSGMRIQIQPGLNEPVLDVP